MVNVDCMVALYGGEAGVPIYFEKGDPLAFLVMWRVRYNESTQKIEESKTKESPTKHRLYRSVCELLKNLYHTSTNIINTLFFSFFYKKIYNSLVFGMALCKGGYGAQKKIYVFILSDEESNQDFSRLNGEVIYRIVDYYLKMETSDCNEEIEKARRKKIKFLDVNCRNLNDVKREIKEESLYEFMIKKLEEIRNKDIGELLDNPFLGVIEKPYTHIMENSEFLMIESEEMPDIEEQGNMFKKVYESAFAALAPIQQLTQPLGVTPSSAPAPSPKPGEPSQQSPLPQSSPQPDHIGSERDAWISAIISAILFFLPISVPGIELIWNLSLLSIYKYMEQLTANMFEFFIVRFLCISIILFLSLVYLMFHYYSDIRIPKDIPLYDNLRSISPSVYFSLLLGLHSVFLWYDFTLAYANTTLLFSVLFVMTDMLMCVFIIFLFLPWIWRAKNGPR